MCPEYRAVQLQERSNFLETFFARGSLFHSCYHLIYCAQASRKYLMKKILLLALLAVASSAFADRIPREWASRYRSMQQIISNKNLFVWQSNLDERFVWIDANGKKRDRRATIASAEDMFKAHKIKCDLKILRVDTNRDQTVDVTFDLRLTLDYGQRNVVRFHEQGVDTWKNIGSRWTEIRTVDKVTTETRAR